MASKGTYLSKDSEQILPINEQLCDLPLSSKKEMSLLDDSRKLNPQPSRGGGGGDEPTPKFSAITLNDKRHRNHFFSILQWNKNRYDH